MDTFVGWGCGFFASVLELSDKNEPTTQPHPNTLLMKALFKTVAAMSAAAFLLSSCGSVGGSSNTIIPAGGTRSSSGFMGGTSGGVITGRSVEADKRELLEKNLEARRTALPARPAA
jgi:hypothetical protein